MREDLIEMYKITQNMNKVGKEKLLFSSQNTKSRCCPMKLNPGKIRTDKGNIFHVAW